ncbi:hypothetical protein AA101099_2687 [Neoasaia chiangmaiensis NBRC 101099]|nr:hypothetical protein AA101099_2687 [Neoasaia chiangmaiensis NBRC 101099]
MIEIELQESIARRHVTVTEIGILDAGRADMGHAETIIGNLDGRPDTPHASHRAAGCACRQEPGSPRQQNMTSAQR